MRDAAGEPANASIRAASASRASGFRQRLAAPLRQFLQPLGLAR